MLKLLVTFIFIIHTAHLYSQPTRNWGAYKTLTKSRVDRLRYSLKEVVVTLRTVVVDTCTDANDRLERTITTSTTKKYSSGTIKSYVAENGGINRYIAGSTRLILDVPGIAPSISDTAREYSSELRGNKVSINNIEVIDTFLTKGQRRNVYDLYYSIKFTRPRFFIGTSYAALAGYRWILVNDPKFNNQAIIESRGQNEYVSFSRAVHLQVGVVVKRAHHWYAEGYSIKQAFKSKGPIIDWNTGLPQNNTSISNTYSFFSTCAGLGYTYSGYSRIVNFVADFGLSAILLHTYKDNINQNIAGRSNLAANPVTANLSSNGLISKFGLGINFRTYNHVSIRLVPTLYYNLTAISKGTLKTGLMNYGVSTGVFLR